jgi:hypothetical protein
MRKRGRLVSSVDLSFLPVNLRGGGGVTIFFNSRGGTGDDGDGTDVVGDNFGCFIDQKAHQQKSQTRGDALSAMA